MSAAIDLTIADTGFSDAANQPQAVPGASFLIEPKLQYNGDAPDTPVGCSIYLSPTPTLTDQSILIYNGTTTTPAPFSNQQLELVANGTLPPSVTPGTWYPIVVVDPENQIAESDESNNTAVADPVTVTLLPHDDLIAPTSVTTNSTWLAGSTIQISGPYEPMWKLYPVTFSYALSVDDIPGNADDILLGAYTAPPADSWHPGGPVFYPMFVYSPLHEFPYPANLPPGQYHLVTTVDPDNAIVDPDRTNNSTVSPLVTILPAGTVDLTIAAPDLPDGNTATAGSHIRIVSPARSAYGPVAYPTVSYILSSDDTVGNDDDILLGSAKWYAIPPDAPGFAPSHYDFVPTDITLPSSLAPGHYKLFAVVDPDNQIAEYDESNNVSPGVDLTISDAPIITPLPVTLPIFGHDPILADPATPITVTPPTTDPATQPLLASAPTFLPTLPGSSHKTSFTLTNPTSKTTSAKYKITFYLSSDDTLSTDDKPISTQTLSLTLRPGKTKTHQLTYKLPRSTQPGQQYVIAVVTPVRPTGLTVQTPPPTLPIDVVTPQTKSKTVSRRSLSTYDQLTTT